MSVSHIGSTTVLGDNVIGNVLFVPDFKCTLLSVSQLIKELNCMVVFFPEFCGLQDLSNGQVKGIGREDQGLYILKDDFTHSAAHTSCSQPPITSNTDSSTLWHRRLGHAHVEILKKSGSLDGLENVISPPCTVCPLAKQSKLHFPVSSHNSKALFDLVRCDIWGPYRFPLMLG